MNKVIWLLCLLLIINWLCNYKLTEWKVQKIQQTAEHIEQKIDKVVTELEQYLKNPLDHIKLEMKDDEAWTKTKRLLENSSTK